MSLLGCVNCVLRKSVQLFCGLNFILVILFSFLASFFLLVRERKTKKKIERMRGTEREKEGVFGENKRQKKDIYRKKKEIKSVSNKDRHGVKHQTWKHTKRHECTQHLWCLYNIHESI